MDIIMVRDALLWCTLINYGFLAAWGGLFVSAHGWLHRLTSKWFHMSVEQFAAINYAGIVLYKTGIFLFNLVPYLALRIAA